MDGFTACPAGLSAAPEAKGRPLWLLREPRKLTGLPQLQSPPERIETAWWDQADVRRDYYLAELDGSKLWIFRDALSREWWLHGVWA